MTDYQGSSEHYEVRNYAGGRAAGGGDGMPDATSMLQAHRGDYERARDAIEAQIYAQIWSAPEKLRRWLANLGAERLLKTRMAETRRTSHYDSAVKLSGGGGHDQSATQYSNATASISQPSNDQGQRCRDTQELPAPVVGRTRGGRPEFRPGNALQTWPQVYRRRYRNKELGRMVRAEVVAVASWYESSSRSHAGEAVFLRQVARAMEGSTKPVADVIPAARLATWVDAAARKAKRMGIPSLASRAKKTA